MQKHVDIYTQLLLTHGNIQMQPKAAQRLNQKPIIAFFAKSGSVREIPGYQVLLTGYAQAILQREARDHNFSYIRLEALLTSLRAMPRAADAKQLKGSVSTYALANDTFRADYRIFNGQIVVYNIQPVDTVKRARDKLEKAGLYQVTRNNHGEWRLTGKTDKVNSPYAAINGQSNNLNKAVWLMGQHLSYQFKQVQDFTLFHNPSDGGFADTWESLRDKFGITTNVTKKFSRIMDDAQARDHHTDWVVHSQGAIIFSEAVRYLLNDGSRSPLNNFSLNGFSHPDKGQRLDKQRVAFHGNASNRLRSSALFKRAGIEVLPGQSTDYDFVRNIVGLNTLNPFKWLGSLVYANHVFDGSISQSPHTLAQSQDQWLKNMKEGFGRGRGAIQEKLHRITENAVPARTSPNYLM